MLFFVTGANGTGKTSCILELALLLPAIAIYDFSVLYLPENPDAIWRQEMTELQIRTYIEKYQSCAKHAVVSAEAVFGGIHASPSVDFVDAWHACLLDCDDVTRVDRLRKRGTHDPNMDILCWVAWMCVHAVDPTWAPEVIQATSHPDMRWDRVARFKRGDPLWHQPVSDTSHLTMEETASTIAQWVTECIRRR